MNENNVYDILQKCKLNQLKKLYREMKKPKEKGVFGYEFVSYHKLPNIAYFKQSCLQKWLLEAVYGVCCHYITTKNTHETLPAMEYNDWEKGNYGYERLVERSYCVNFHAYNSAIEYCINYIKKITNIN